MGPREIVIFSGRSLATGEAEGTTAVISEAKRAARRRPQQASRWQGFLISGTKSMGRFFQCQWDMFFLGSYLGIEQMIAMIAMIAGIVWMKPSTCWA